MNAAGYAALSILAIALGRSSRLVGAGAELLRKLGPVYEARRLAQHAGSCLGGTCGAPAPRGWGCVRRCRAGVVRCARAFLVRPAACAEAPRCRTFSSSAARVCAVVSVLAGANNGLLQAEAKKYMGGLGEADRAAALDDARAFRRKYPARSSGAMAAFDNLSKIKQLAVRILASITGGVHGGDAAQPHRRAA